MPPLRRRCTLVYETEESRLIVKYREKIAYFQDFDYRTFINNPQVEAFIGKDYEHFKVLWTSDFEKKKGNALRVITSLHWTWLGVLAGPIVWFSYRKMYKLAWGLVGLFSAATFLEDFFGLHVGSGAYMGANLMLALMAKGYYFEHVVGFFHENKDASQAQMAELIATKGGTSTLAAVIMFVMGIICVIAASILGDLAAGHQISLFAEVQTTSVTTSTEGAAP